MPTYEYRCRDCGHTFEIVQKMSDEPLTHCPECGGELRKVFAPPAISFKGSGFYATDHGKKAKPSSDEGDKASKEAASKDGGSEDGGGKSDSAKKDAKSDAKATSTPAPAKKDAS
jgi:putative FmdB family regulatory protein